MDGCLRYDKEGVSKRFLVQKVKSALASEMCSCEECRLQKVVLDVWSGKHEWRSMQNGVKKKDKSPET